MKVMVTGSHGFIGSHLVLALSKLGHEVVEVDRRNKAYPLSIRRVEADDTVKWVFHLAAHTDAQDERAEEMADTNVSGTAQLARLFGPRLILASTLMARLENSPYAISKAAAERYTRLYGGKVIRLPNVYGRGGHSVIDVFAACAKNNQFAEIRGDGTQLREYIHVDKAVEAFITATVTDDKMVSICGARLSVKDIADMMHVQRIHVSRSKFDPEIGY